MAIYPTIYPTSERESDKATSSSKPSRPAHAGGCPVCPIGAELVRTQIGDLTSSDADVLRLAESHGLVEAS